MIGPRQIRGKSCKGPKTSRLNDRSFRTSITKTSPHQFYHLNLPPSPSIYSCDGVSSVSSQPLTELAQPRCPQFAFGLEERFRNPHPEQQEWCQDRVNHPFQWSNGTPIDCIELAEGLLTVIRSPRSTHHGRRLRPLVYGLMLDLEQKPIRQTAQHTSWSIWLSR